ncbi:MAG: aminopeptidase N, partial [Chloroflexi bacterium]|nr:aminopeptidase N [Chloroflexota bacterium]
MTSDRVAMRDVLTQEAAAARAECVSDVSYELHLDLTAGAERYRGEVTIWFTRTGAGDVFLDHRGGGLERLEVNGAELEPDATPYRLTLPGAALAARNEVRLVFEHAYDHTGDGFHQFIDPEDGSEYLYTNFEPYNAHRLFPCFDQPDLKATYTLSVDAPAEWELIANAAEAARETLPDGRLRRSFATTDPFSTYLLALIVGPYHVVRDEHDGVPLGFYCRKSLAQYLDTDELFAVTKQGLDFYGTFFDYPYAFGKYDQIFVPEFNFGAMENVGAITHSERMVFRDPPTENQRLGRAEVILHEMAHMWFGDLVTMRWWNDLWLNESFATYMAYLAMAEATRFQSSWLAFNSGMKAWAYRQDQLVTTHPIAGAVPDTDATFLNFDGITYGKGAAVLKQLVAAVGIDGFREGMRRYFQRHAFGNTTLAEFLDAIDEGVDRDLHAWAALWLETASLNTIGAHWETSGDTLDSLAIEQTAPADYPTLRPHQLDVALLTEADGRVEVGSLSAWVEGARTEVQGAAGRPAPLLVMPNLNDHAFVKVALDERSLDYVREGLERIQEPLLRQLIWQALWNMVRDQQLRSTEYLPLVASKIIAETDIELIETALATVTSAIARYVPEDRRDEEAHRFSEVAWAALAAAPAGDQQIIWARTLIGLAITPGDIARVCALADGEHAVPGFTVDQDMRWDIAARAVGHGLAGAEA